MYYTLSFNTHVFAPKMAVTKLCHYCLKNEEEIDGCNNKMRYIMLNFMHPVFYITKKIFNDTTIPEQKRFVLLFE